MVMCSCPSCLPSFWLIFHVFYRSPHGKEGNPLASETIDCLWQGRFSTTVVEVVKFKPADVANSCLLVSAEIVEAQPKRAENKVKLVSMMIF